MTTNIGTLITSPIRPWDDADIYPSCYASEIKGGHHAVADISARDAIPDGRLEIGMFCTTIDSGNVYQLMSLAPLWVEFASSSSDLCIEIHTAGENLVLNDLCYLDESDGKFYKVDNTAESTSTGLIAFSTESIVADATGSFVLCGDIDGSALIGGGTLQGVIYYIDVNGITATKPTNVGEVIRIIGYGLPSGDFKISPSITWEVVSKVATLHGVENLDQVNSVYTITHATVIWTSSPVVTLEMPLEGSLMYSVTVVAIGATSFKAILSGIPAAAGYKINWVIHDTGV